MHSDFLIIYASKPSGHGNAATAISEAIKHTNPGIRVSELDFFTHSYPFLGPSVASLYLEIVQKLPDIWDYIYHNKKIEEGSRDIRKLFNLIQVPKIKKYLKKHAPKIVVSTHAATTSILAGMRENGDDFFLSAAITDFCTNNYWPLKGVDMYFVPTMNVKNELAARGVKNEIIKVTGIPVRRDFDMVCDRENILESLGLKKNIFTLLIMGGNHGIGPIDDIVRLLYRSGIMLQLIVVCGHNKALEKKLIRKNYKKSSVKILGYVNNISGLMDASDILVAKAGGITIAEAVYKKLPIIIFNPLPAQEIKNTEYLLKKNAALFCKTNSELLNGIKLMATEPSKLAYYQKNMQSVMPLKGSRTIASVLSRKYLDI